MVFYISKIIITTVLIVVISEISKRSTLVGGILASIPIISVLAIVWLYIDTKNSEIVSKLALSIFWLVIPSLALFITLPIFLKKGWNFYLSIGISIAITIACYYGIIMVLGKFGIKL